MPVTAPAGANGVRAGLDGIVLSCTFRSGIARDFRGLSLGNLALLQPYHAQISVFPYWPNRAVLPFNWERSDQISPLGLDYHMRLGRLSEKCS